MFPHTETSYEMVESYLEQQTAVYSALTERSLKNKEIANLTDQEVSVAVCGWDHEASEDNIEHWNSTISFYDLTTENNDLEIHGTKWWGHSYHQGNQACGQRKSVKQVLWPWASGFPSQGHCFGSKVQDTSPPGACLPTKNLWGSRHRSPEQSWTGMYWFYTNDDVFLFL